MKTSELKGAALDWAVAKDVGETYSRMHHFGLDVNSTYIETLDYSTDWDLTGPLIDRFKILLCPSEHHVEQWEVSVNGDCEMHYGETPLIAICRAVVAYVIGDEIELPADLAVIV